MSPGGPQIRCYSFGMRAEMRAIFRPVSTLVTSQVARIKSSTLARNSLWVFAGSGMSIFIQSFYFMVIARLLTPSQVGLFVGATSFVALVASYSSLGTGAVYLRHVSQDRSRHAVYFGNIIMTIAALGSLLALGVHFSSRWLEGPGSVLLVTVVAIGDIFFLNVAGTMSQVFQTYELMRISAFMGLFGNASRFLVAAALLLFYHQVSAQTWAYATVTVSFLCAVISLAIAIARFGPPVFRPRLAIKHAPEGLSFAMSGTAVGAYNDIDKVMLVHYGMSAANGIYAMAYRVVDVCTAPIRSIHAAAFPRFFRLGAGGVEPTVQFALRLLRKTSVIGLLGVLCLLVGAPLLPHIIGRNYQGSVLAMRWLCLLPLFRSFHLSAGDALAGIGYQKFRLGAQFTAAGFNFGVNLFLIPRFSWVGAAWSSLATDGALAVMCWASLLYLLQRESRLAAIEPNPLMSPSVR